MAQIYSSKQAIACDRHAGGMRVGARAALAALTIWAGSATAQSTGSMPALADDVTSIAAIGLLLNETPNRTSACGAVQISERLIMSAAGCFYHPDGDTRSAFTFAPGFRPGLPVEISGIPRRYGSFAVVRVHHPARYLPYLPQAQSVITRQFYDIAFAELGDQLEPNVGTAGWAGTRSVTPSFAFGIPMQAGLATEWDRLAGPYRTACQMHWSEQSEDWVVQALETRECWTRPILEGSPAFDIDSSGAQYAIGVITNYQRRVDLQEGFMGIAPLTPDRVRIMRRLIDGSGEAGAEEWVAHDLNGARTVPSILLNRGHEVYLTNYCPQWRMFVIAHYFDVNANTWEWGERRQESDFRGTVMPRQGETRHLFSTRNSVFYINLHDQGLRNLTRDDIRFQVPDTVNGNMFPVRDSVRFQEFNLETQGQPQPFRVVNLELTSSCRLELR